MKAEVVPRIRFLTVRPTPTTETSAWATTLGDGWNWSNEGFDDDDEEDR